MKTYSVRMSRRDGGWDAGIDGVGWIRVDRLTGVERAVRSHLAVLGFGDAATAHIELDHGPDLGKKIEEVREARTAAEGWVRYAAQRSRELAADLAAQGLSGAEIAMVLGVSPQRVSQLIAPPQRKKRASATGAGTEDVQALLDAGDLAESVATGAPSPSDEVVDLRTAEEKAAAKLLKKQRKADKAARKAAKKQAEAQKAS